MMAADSNGKDHHALFAALAVAAILMLTIAIILLMTPAQMD